MTRVYQAVAVALALSVAGCNTPIGGPSRRAASGRPLSNAGGSRTAPSAESVLNAPDSPYDLREVVELASERAFDVRIAAESLIIARELAEEARRAWLPRLTVGLTYARLDGKSQTTVGNFPIVERQSLGLGGALNLSVDTGQAVYGTRAAELDARASELGLVSTRFETVLTAARLFTDVRLAKRSLAIATEAVEQAGALEQWVTQRVERGAALNVDLERVRARSAEALRDEIEMGFLVEEARANLSNLLDLSADVEFATPDVGDEASQARIPESALDNVERWLSLLNEHPELARRRALSEAASERATGAEKDWMLPRLELGIAFDEFGENFSDLDRRERYQASLLWDLDFSQGARARRVGAESQRTRLEMLRTRRRLETGVRLSFRRVMAARESLPVADAQVTAARAAYDLALERQNQGRGLLIDSLDALLVVRRAELGQAAASSALERAELDLLLASGSESLSVLGD